jgi:HEAT repeats
MARSHRRFGRLFYATAIVALLAIVSIPFFPTVIYQSSAWRLTHRLHSSDESVRREAVEGLVRIGPAATPWVIRAMRDPDAGVRALACSALMRTMPEDAEAPLAALLAAAKDSDPSVRAAAVEQLELFIARYGSPSESRAREKAIGAMGALIRDGAPLVRHMAIRSVQWNLGPLAKPAIGDLERVLVGADKSTRVLAAEALLRVDLTATRSEVMAAMSALLTDQSIPLEHWSVVKILAREQGEDTTAAMLIPLLKHPDRGTRLQAINDLTTHCTQAKALKPALIAALASDDVGLRCEAALFLMVHDPSMVERAIDLVAEEIAGPFEGSYLQWNLIDRMSRESPDSLTRLAQVLVDKLARTNEPIVRVNAIRALGEIGPKAMPALPSLLDASRSGDPKIALRAVAALVKIDPALAASWLPSLLDWMKPGQDRTIRLEAIASLRDLGPAAATAIPSLLHLADEEDLAISAAAIEAISRIDPAMGAALKQSIEKGAPRSRDDR